MFPFEYRTAFDVASLLQGYRMTLTKSTHPRRLEFMLIWVVFRRFMVLASNPRTQRKNAGSAPKQSFKELPEGWTREKVASKYYAAPSKSIFLQKWGEKYPNFKLTRQKANEWEKLFIHSETE